jgi:hypothetical protein
LAVKTALLFDPAARYPGHASTHLCSSVETYRPRTKGPGGPSTRLPFCQRHGLATHCRISRWIIVVDTT